MGRGPPASSVVLNNPTSVPLQVPILICIIIVIMKAHYMFFFFFFFSKRCIHGVWGRNSPLEWCEECGERSAAVELAPPRDLESFAYVQDQEQRARKRTWMRAAADETSGRSDGAAGGSGGGRSGTWCGFHWRMVPRHQTMEVEGRGSSRAWVSGGRAGVGLGCSRGFAVLLLWLAPRECRVRCHCEQMVCVCLSTNFSHPYFEPTGLASRVK